MLAETSQPRAGAAGEDLTAAEQRIGELQAENARLRERIRLLGKALFGPKSERLLAELITEEGLREEIVLNDLPEEQRISLQTGEPLVKIGEDRGRKLAVKPLEYYVKVSIIPRHAGPADVRLGVVSAPAPNSAIPGGSYDGSFVADVVVTQVAQIAEFGVCSRLRTVPGKERRLWRTC